MTGRPRPTRRYGSTRGCTTRCSTSLSGTGCWPTSAAGLTGTSERALARPAVQRIHVELPDFGHAPVQILQLPAVDGDRGQDRDVDFARPHHERLLPEQVSGVAEHDRNQRHAGLHGDMKCALLEWADAVCC